MRLLPGAFAALLLSPVQAQEPAPLLQSQAIECSATASATNLVAPIDRATRIFANGAVRFFHVDVEEPVCCSSRIVVGAPSGDGSDDPIFTMCREIVQTDGYGFQDVDLPSAQARYDPVIGLTVDVPVRLYDDGGPGIRRTVRILVNQSTGTIETR